MTNYWQLAQRMASLCPIFISFIPNSQSARTHTKRHLSLYTDIQMHTPNEKHNKNDPLYILSASTRVGAEELQVSSYRVPEQTLVESHTYLTCVVYSLCRICAWLSIKAPILQPTFFRSCDAVTFFFFFSEICAYDACTEKVIGYMLFVFLFECMKRWISDPWQVLRAHINSDDLFLHHPYSHNLHFPVDLLPSLSNPVLLSAVTSPICELNKFSPSKSSKRVFVSLSRITSTDKK